MVFSFVSCVVCSVGFGGELPAVPVEVARLRPRPRVEHQQLSGQRALAHQQFPGLGTLQFLGRSADLAYGSSCRCFCCDAEFGEVVLGERLQCSVREVLPRPKLVHDCIVWSGKHLKAISRQAFVGNLLVEHYRRLKVICWSSTTGV